MAKDKDNVSKARSYLHKADRLLAQYKGELGAFHQGLNDVLEERGYERVTRWNKSKAVEAVTLVSDNISRHSSEVTSLVDRLQGAQDAAQTNREWAESEGARAETYARAIRNLAKATQYEGKLDKLTPAQLTNFSKHLKGKAHVYGEKTSELETELDTARNYLLAEKQIEKKELKTISDEKTIALLMDYATDNRRVYEGLVEEKKQWDAQADEKVKQAEEAGRKLSGQTEEAQKKLARIHLFAIANNIPGITDEEKKGVEASLNPYESMRQLIVAKVTGMRSKSEQYDAVQTYLTKILLDGNIITNDQTLSLRDLVQDLYEEGEKKSKELNVTKNQYQEAAHKADVWERKNLEKHMRISQIKGHLNYLVDGLREMALAAHERYKADMQRAGFKVEPGQTLEIKEGFKNVTGALEYTKGLFELTEEALHELDSAKKDITEMPEDGELSDESAKRIAKAGNTTIVLLRKVLDAPAAPVDKSYLARFHSIIIAAGCMPNDAYQINTPEGINDYLEKRLANLEEERKRLGVYMRRNNILDGKVVKLEYDQEILRGLYQAMTSDFVQKACEAGSEKRRADKLENEVRYTRSIQNDAAFTSLVAAYKPQQGVGFTDLELEQVVADTIEARMRNNVTAETALELISAVSSYSVFPMLDEVGKAVVTLLDHFDKFGSVKKIKAKLAKLPTLMPSEAAETLVR
jgi:hypothetical protein